jgi:hypothetical protein
MPLPAGNYSVSGGEATSGNGDSIFDASGNKFGGLNYSAGVSPLVLVLAAIAAVLVIKYV